MVDPAVEEILAYNQEALEELGWAIEASQGQFSLTLARCNYASLRDQLVTQIQQACTVKLLVTPLKQGSKTLYTRLRELTDSTPVEALMVLGLESVDDLEEMLPAVNSVREEFRKNFPFPIVLWVTDAVHSKLVQLAPDFESWATTTDFTLPPNALLNALRDASARLFSTLLTPDSSHSFRRLLENLDLGFLQRSEVEVAIRDLQKTEQTLTPDLQATLHFLRGLNAHTNQEALEHFQRSLEYWQQLASPPTPRPTHYTPHLISGLLLYFVGRSLYNICSENKYRQENWEPPKQPLQDCLMVFEQATRPDLVAKSITQLERVLNQLKAWEALETLAQKSLSLQQTYNDNARQAQDYRYLALTAIQRGQGAEAKRYAERALELTEQVSEDQRYRGLYLLTLAEATKLTGQRDAALTCLNEARSLGDQGIPRVYIAILEELRTHYIEQKDYLEAFRLKQERLSVEQQYQLRAFVGAGRLRAQRQDREALRSQNVVGTTDHSSLPTETPTTGIASWQRQRDVKQLLERIGRNDCKLIVIHGYSGVGKSSLISAGLVPTLEQKAIGLQPNLPVVVRKYTDWAEELGRRMAEALEDSPSAPTTPYTTHHIPQSLIAQLRHNGQRNLRTILIFDQFEEFFFVYPTPALRRPFFEFLGQCLQLLSVKVVLSLREDYLYYLLEFNRIPEISTTGIDVLSRNVLYPLGNFAPDDARVIIQELTEQARFYLERSLVEALVADLTDENGEVRPIELQIVGAQLQTDNIRDLETYDSLREAGKPAKEVLVGRYLAEVVADCGTDNQRAAELVLYLLTDENDTRPLKTRAELVEDMKEETSKLDFVLEILVRSGLVMLLPEVPTDRYQLVHDYLVRYIRQEQESSLLARLANAQEQNKQTTAQLRETLTQLEQALRQEQNARKQSEQLRVEAEKNEIRALCKSSEALFALSQVFDALLESLRAAAKLKRSMWTNENSHQTATDRQLQAQVEKALRQSVYAVQEYNRLEDVNFNTLPALTQDLPTNVAGTGLPSEAKTSVVWSVCFSPDGQKLATAGTDGAVKLWSSNGNLLKTLRAGSISRWVRFSPNGQVLASAHEDGTIRLWKADSTDLTILEAHTADVSAICFSPDGQILASASYDGTVKLWTLNGDLIISFSSHAYAVKTISFSPNGRMIASASNVPQDNSLRLWSLDGTLLTTLPNEGSTSLSFSPDGQMLALSGDRATVKLIKLDGEVIATFKGHRQQVLNICFSSDGQAIASAGSDGTVKMWDLKGKDLKTLRHRSSVNDVSFSPDGQILASACVDGSISLWNPGSSLLTTLPSEKDQWFYSANFSPNGQFLVAGSSNGTVTIWNRQGVLLTTLQGHSGKVFKSIFSSDGQTIATASFDKTVKLWHIDGTLLQTFQHDDRVWSVSFSPDGQMLVSGGAETILRLWHRDGRLLKTLTNPGNQHSESVSFSPDGQLIAAATTGGTVDVWNVGGTFFKSLEGHGRGLHSITFSADGQLIASASRDNTAKLWSRDGQLLRTFQGHRNWVADAKFSPDGQVLATASFDRTIKLWQLDGTLLATLQVHEDEIYEISFSPDGKTLASASRDGRVILWNWNLNADELLAYGCNWVRDYLRTNPNVSESDRHLCDGISKK
jgi:WD40 repeat protein